jgi:transposase, IS6 family
VGVFIYRAVDSSGPTIDFLLSAKRDAAAAERFRAKALGGENHPAPRVINTDKHAAYPPAIAGLQSAGDLADNCQHRSVQYLNRSVATLQEWSDKLGRYGPRTLSCRSVQVATI